MGKFILAQGRPVFMGRYRPAKCDPPVYGQKTLVFGSYLPVNRGLSLPLESLSLGYVTYRLFEAKPCNPLHTGKIFIQRKRFTM